jgi:hypothetical protein
MAGRYIIRGAEVAFLKCPRVLCKHVNYHIGVSLAIQRACYAKDVRVNNTGVFTSLF